MRKKKNLWLVLFCCSLLGASFSAYGLIRLRSESQTLADAQTKRATAYAQKIEKAAGAWHSRSADESLELYQSAIRKAETEHEQAVGQFSLGQCYAKNGMVQIFLAPDEGAEELWQAALAYKKAHSLEQRAQTDPALAELAEKNCARAMLILNYLAPGTTGPRQDKPKQADPDDPQEDFDEESEEEMEDEPGPSDETELAEEEEERESATANLDPKDILEKEIKKNRFREKNRELIRKAGKRDW